MVLWAVERGPPGKVPLLCGREVENGSGPFRPSELLGFDYGEGTPPLGLPFQARREAINPNTFINLVFSGQLTNSLLSTVFSEAESAGFGVSVKYAAWNENNKTKTRDNRKGGLRFLKTH